MSVITRQVNVIRAMARAGVRCTRVLLGLAALTWSALAHPSDVLIVTSSEASPYRAAAQAARKTLLESGKSSRTLPLEKLSLERIHAEIDKQGEQEKPPLTFLAVGTRAAVFLRKHLPVDTRLVYCMATNVEGNRLAQRRNTVGISAETALRDQFRLVRRTLPDVRRIGVLYRSDVRSSRAIHDKLVAGLPDGFELRAVDLREYPSFSAGLNQLVALRPELIWTAADRSVYKPAAIRTLLLAALRAKVPVFGFSAPAVRAGACLGITMEPTRQGTRAVKVWLDWLREDAKRPRADTGGDSKNGRGKGDSTGRKESGEMSPQREKNDDGEKGVGPLGKESHQSAELQAQFHLVVAGKLGIEIPARLLKTAHHVYGKPSRGRR